MLSELAHRPPTAMSSFDTNPFTDPVDVNPFQDPSVTQLTNAPQGGLAEFNPFSETNAAMTVPVSQMPGPSQPAVFQPSVEPTQPTPQTAASAAQASLLRQQEELDRKAAELERKERELQNTVANLHGKGGHATWLRTSLSLLVPGQPQSFAELCHGIVLGNTT